MSWPLRPKSFRLELGSALQQEFLSRGIPYTRDGPFRIELDKSRTAQHVIHAIQTPLSLLRVHEPTVEEAYIEIINKTNESTVNGIERP